MATALARRSPKAMLYSGVPRSSAWPSTTTLTDVFSFKNLACASKIAENSLLTDDLSKSK